MDIDRAVELARSADVENLITVDEDFVYNKKGWHNDCADIITSDDIDKNDAMRVELGVALYWFDAIQDNRYQKTDHVLLRLQSLHDSLYKLGQMVLLNAIENGLTIKKAGE